MITDAFGRPVDPERNYLFPVKGDHPHFEAMQCLVKGSPCDPDLLMKVIKGGLGEVTMYCDHDANVVVDDEDGHETTAALWVIKEAEEEQA